MASAEILSASAEECESRVEKVRTFVRAGVISVILSRYHGSMA